MPPWACVCKFCCGHFHFLGIDLGLELPGPMSTPCSTLWGATRLFFRWLSLAVWGIQFQNRLLPSVCSVVPKGVRYLLFHLCFPYGYSTFSCIINQLKVFGEVLIHSHTNFRVWVLLLFYFFCCKGLGREMAQWVRVIAAKTNDLSMDLWDPHGRQRGENWSLQVLLCPPHVWRGMCAWAHTH